MNVYFWLFASAAILSLPLAMEVTLRLDQKLRYRIRFHLAGVRVAQKRKQDEEAGENVVSAQTAKGLFSLDGRLAWRLLRGGHVLKALRVMKLDSIHVHARLSFQDAALTAVAFSGFRMVAQTLLLCLRPSVHIGGRVEMDYAGQGTQARLQCIFSCRLGILLAAALRLVAAILSARSELMKTEEEPYAAASH